VEKQKFAEKLKGKGYYVLLLVGVASIALVAFIGTRLSSDKGNDNEFVDLNEYNNVENNANDNNHNMLAENQIPDRIVNTEKGNNSENEKVSEKISNDDLIEFDVYAEKDEKGIDLSEDDKADEVVKEEPEAVAVDGKTVEARKTNNLQNSLKFTSEKGLAWPIEGDILMEYNMDSTIYHKTLMVFKCNPALIIGAKEDSKIVAAVDGKVTELVKNEETGLTITMDIGSKYNLVYGQLKDVSLAVGDIVKEGDIIGSIAKPTKYYSVEGSNLYFQVINDEKPVNPMSLLRD